MTLSGTYTVNAPAQTIWNMLMDPDTLARVTPGITSLEKIDADNFKAVAEVKVGPVGGAFTGNLKISDRQEPEHFTLEIQQNSKIGNANAVVHLNMKALSPNQTEVSFEGEVKLSGMLASMGARVVTPVANMLSKQFFEGLEQEVAAA